MTAITFAPFGTLTQDQANRLWEIWHDPTDPHAFVYCLHGDNVVGRTAINRKATGKGIHGGPMQYAPRPAPPAPAPIKSPAPKLTRDVLHELPRAMRQAKPKRQRRRSTYGTAQAIRDAATLVLIVTLLIAFQ